METVKEWLKPQICFFSAHFAHTVPNQKTNTDCDLRRFLLKSADSSLCQTLGIWRRSRKECREGQGGECNLLTRVLFLSKSLSLFPSVFFSRARSRTKTSTGVNNL